jgi:hypothetical protein
MNLTTDFKSQKLQLASICYIITGLGYLHLSFRFLFLNAVDELPKGHDIAPLVFLNDEIGFELVPFVSILSLFIATYSLWKIGEPTGFGTRRNFFFVTMAGTISYNLAAIMPLPFAPLGALLCALGMILVGIAVLRTRMWTGWKRFTPLLVGCYPFIFMFPLLILTGARPPVLIGLWGFTWILLGIAVWMRRKEISDQTIKTI